MKKRVIISEPERLERFMHSFDENHNEDFKALVLHLISNSDITTVSKKTGLAESTLYDWQSDWNKKRNAARNNQAYKILEDKVADQNHV